MSQAIRVLIADDSAVARALLRSFLEADGGFDVIGEARHGREAVAMTLALRPDLVTMDLEMPVMGGLEAIEEIMSSKATPILVVSSVADARNAFAAVSHGAVDVVSKPSVDPVAQAAFVSKARLVASIPVITHVRALRVDPSRARPGPSAVPVAPPVAPPVGVAAGAAGMPVFAVASSTGGPQALATILAALPADFCGSILIAQHISEGFASGMAAWLATLSTLPVHLGREGAMVLPGHVYVAPSETHMAVLPGGRLTLQGRAAGDVYRPACDVLLETAATVYGKRCVGLILTGMGSDGARGLAAIQAAGGHTIAQDEDSSVVFGMNRVAIERGAAEEVLPLSGIAPAMCARAAVRP